MRWIYSICLIFLLSLPAEGALRRLKQSTDTTIEIHLVNATTGAAITGATPGSVTAFIKKHTDTGSTTVTNLTITGTPFTNANDLRELALGAYNLEITAAQTDTLGGWTLCYSYSAAVVTCDTYEVIASASYDSGIGGNIASVSDFFSEAVPGAYAAGTFGYIAGNNLRYSVAGTSDSGTTTTMVDAARTEADTNYWVGSVIVFTSGTISGQTRYITGFNASTDTITFDPATTQAVGTQSYEIRPGVDYVRFNSIYEGTQTFKTFLQYGASALFGKYNSSGGTFNFRDIADTLNRIVYTTTATSRSSVTLTPTP